MGKYIVENTISNLDQQGVPIDGAKISILGLTFKENCPDLRNTKVISIYQSLKQYNCKLIITDEWADNKEVRSEFGVGLKSLNDIKNQDAIILAVGHKEYSNFNRSDWMKMLKPKGVLIDIKSLYNKETFSNEKLGTGGYRFMSETILVTGCAGFIGMHLCKNLLEDDYVVMGIDNLNDYYDPNLKKARLQQLNKYKNSNLKRQIFVICLR